MQNPISEETRPLMPGNLPDRAYLTASEVSVAFRVDEGTVRRLGREGSLPTVKLGPRIVRYPREALIEWTMNGEREERLQTESTQAENRRVMLLARVPEHVRTSAREAARLEGLTMTAWIEAVLRERIERPRSIRP